MTSVRYIHGKTRETTKRCKEITESDKG